MPAFCVTSANRPDPSPWNNLPPSTVYAILRREKLNRLDRLHRSTREVIRYEHDRPGSLLHMDVKRTWRIPPGGGRRYELTEQGGESISRSGKRGYGYDCLHVAIDDHSRYLYTELLPDQSGSTTVGWRSDLGETSGSMVSSHRGLATRITDRARWCGVQPGMQDRGRPGRPERAGARGIRFARSRHVRLEEWRGAR